MSGFLKNNPMALRHCILFEVLRGTPIDEAYYKFCDTIGEDFMEYREFDFWYYRFLNGEFDPNFERDKNEKSHELMDMPIDVLTKIVEYLDIVDRIKLARTSRSFQTFVDDQKLFHHTLKLRVSTETSNVSFNESHNMEYYWIYGPSVPIPETFQIFIPASTHWRQAVQTLDSILKNPKFHSDFLVIELAVDLSYFQIFESTTDNLLNPLLKYTHHLKVKNLILHEFSSDQLSRILPTLKPGYLTNIEMISYNPNVDSMNTIFEMEQWKQAKCFSMAGTYFIWPLLHLYHFKEFSVCLMRLSVEDIRQMKEVLFKSLDFENCCLTVYGDIDFLIFDQELGGSLREHPYIYHYPIPGSTDYFEIEVIEFGVQAWSIRITRKK